MSKQYGYPYNRMTTVSAQGPEVQFDRQLLQTYTDLLGSNTIFFLPMLEKDPAITVLENIDHGPLGHHFATVTAFDNDPCHKGLMLTYRFNGTDEGLVAADHADFTRATGGTADLAMSLGMWFNASDPVAAQGLITKIDDQAATNVEWELFLDGAGKINFVTHDDGVPATIGRLYNTVLTDHIWYFVVATKSTGVTSAAIDIYLAAATDSSISAVDDTNNAAGAYVAMEDKAAGVYVGMTENSGAGAGEWFTGQIWGPFLVGEEMTSTKITNLFNAGKKLLGF